MSSIAAQSNPWIVRLKPNPAARIRLFCIPFAGGDPSVFMRWPEKLPSFIQVCPILLPGRWTRMQEPPFTDMAQLIQALGEGIRSELQTPKAFFGHSTGALIAFELARWLREHSGREPLHLFVSGSEAPHLALPGNAIHDLNDADFLDRARAFQGISEDVLAEPELRQMILPILRADFQLTHSYSYKPARPLECPLTACAGSHDSFVSHSDLEAWRSYTASRFSAHTFPGDHMFLLKNNDGLLKMIGEELAFAPV